MHLIYNSNKKLGHYYICILVFQHCDVFRLCLVLIISIEKSNFKLIYSSRIIVISVVIFNSQNYKVKSTEELTKFSMSVILTLNDKQTKLG